MINITYSPHDAHSAEQMQNELTQANLQLDNPILIVLVTPDAMVDSSVQSAIEQAKRANHVIVPVILQPTEPNAALRELPSLDLSTNYRSDKLISFIRRADVGKERIGKNRRLLFVIAGIVLIMFVISLFAIGSGIVAFPIDEYATENAIRDSQINTIVAPQLEELRPRTTDDALNFQSTLNAIDNDDLLPFVIGTATAIPEQFQATNEARSTQAFETEAAQTQSAGN